jgi:hypothetical protein
MLLGYHKENSGSCSMGTHECMAMIVQRLNESLKVADTGQGVCAVPMCNIAPPTCGFAG